MSQQHVCSNMRNIVTQSFSREKCEFYSLDCRACRIQKCVFIFCCAIFVDKDKWDWSVVEIGEEVFADGEVRYYKIKL